MNLEQVERALVFSAHPGDGLLGTGGTIARLSKQGTKITVVLFPLEYSRSLAKVRVYSIGVEYGEAFLLSSPIPCKH